MGDCVDCGKKSMTPSPWPCDSLPRSHGNTLKNQQGGNDNYQWLDLVVAAATEHKNLVSNYFRQERKSSASLSALPKTITTAHQSLWKKCCIAGQVWMHKLWKGKQHINQSTKWWVLVLVPSTHQIIVANDTMRCDG